MLPALDLQPKPLVIDFSLISESISQNISAALPEPEKILEPPPIKQPSPRPVKKELPKETPKPVIAKKVLTRPAEKILPQKEEKVVIEENFAEAAEIPVAQPLAATTVSDSLIQRNSSLRAAATASASKQVMEQHYVKAHFVYIKKIIEKNISYPPMARRMGWQGKVQVSFIVCMDGKVADLHIYESSGHAQLDRNALETVRQVAPFPSPPVRVKLILPVTYKIS
jgi:protein TonB